MLLLLLWALVFLSLPGVGYVLLLIWRHRKYAAIPGPPRSSFFTGHLNEILGAKKEGKVFDQLFLDWHVKYGYTVVVFLFHNGVVSCCDPEIIKDVLLQHPRSFPKSSFYEGLAYVFGERTLGHGLLTERDYERWAKERMVLNPAFHRKYLEGLVENINAVADDLVQKLDNAAATETSAELSELFHNATLDVITKVMLNMHTGAAEHDSALSTAIRSIFDSFALSFESAFPNWSPWMYFERKKFRKNLQKVKAHAKTVVMKRLAAIQREETVPQDILTYMVAAHAQDPEFSLDVILDNVMTFMLAGQETSANTLSLIFMELGRHPNVLSKLKAEIDTCIGRQELVTYDNVSSLTYCKMVIKETLRLYPAAPGTTRTCPKEVTYGNIRLPAGTDIKITAYGCSRNPDFVDRPEEFDPDRFDGRSETKIQQTSYFPFSLGPRNCIGQKLAMLEMSIIIAKVLQHFEFELNKSQSFVIVQTGTIHPAHGVWANLCKR